MRGVGMVVVTGNSEGEIGACLDAALATGAEVVVVDNATTDQTRREVLRRPAVRLIANPWNRGLAAALNQGVGALGRPFVLLLDPDAVLLGGVAALVEALSEPAAAAAGGKLVDERGQSQAGLVVRRFPTPPALVFEMLGVNRLWPGNPVNRRYRCRDLNLDAAAEVDQPAGGFLMIRREIWKELGGFDEAFHPVGFEDVDFLKRVRAAGHRIHYLPSAVARRRGERSPGRMPREQGQVYWYDGLLKYATRHFGPAARWVICWAVMLRCAPQAVLGIFRPKGARRLAIHGRIIGLALRCLVSGRSRRVSWNPAVAGW
jgi:GT2 family glycosyltransferase